MQPKKNLNIVKLKDTPYGKQRRKSYTDTILKDQPIFPEPLEYADIDEGFFKFVDERLDMSYNGEKIPTFTLFSNQRFSEYSQMWKHTDNDNNLLLNFKTISRDNNPKFGNNQGGLWNIPGERKYTLAIKNVLEENGTESYEIYSMKQPYAIDISYRIGFVTDKFELINVFNTKLNKMFKARQCYIRVNGHYIPMVIDDISDETSYSIDERKIFVQTFTIKVMAYIINKEDMTIDRVPKRIKLFMEGDAIKKCPTVDIDEYYAENMVNKSLTVTINFKEYHDKVEFTMDTDMNVTNMKTDNIRNTRISVNGTPYYTEKGFKLKEGDNVKVKIRQLDVTQPSSIIMEGYDPNIIYDRTELSEDASEVADKFGEINVETEV